MKKRVIILLTGILVIMSCKKGNENISEKIISEDVESFTLLDNSILKNHEFSSWDTQVKPTHWNINSKLKSPDRYIVDRDSLVVLKGNKDNLVYLEQEFSVQPNTYYLVNFTVKSALNSGRQAAIIIKKEQETLTQLSLKIKGTKNYRAIIKTSQDAKLKCYIGFIEKGGGSLEITLAGISKVKPNFDNYESDIAQFFYNSGNLNFSNEVNFDKSIQKIVTDTEDLLLLEENKSEEIVNSKNKLLGLLENTSNLKTYLTKPEEVKKQYISKLVNSSCEILNEFNIGTQKIDLFNKKGNKMFVLMSYYNPYSETWKTIDPIHKVTIRLEEKTSNILKDNIQNFYGSTQQNQIDKALKKYNEIEKVIYRKQEIGGFPF